MLAFKSVVYVLTIASLFLFGFWEMQVRRRLTEKGAKRESVAKFGALSGISNEIRRELFLESLPSEVLLKLRVIRSLKILFFVILIIEVLVLQR